MDVGIIGAGALGTSLARALAAGGVPTLLSNSRGPDSLAGLVGELGPTVRAGTAGEAAGADLVVLAVRWADLGQALAPLPAWTGRIMVDATNAVAFLDPDSPDARDPANPLAAYGLKAIDLGGRHSSQVVRDHVPGARLVKAFNHLDARAFTPRPVAGGQTTLFLSGDDAGARAEVRTLIGRMGFFPVDLGPLDVGGPLASLPFGPLSAAPFARL